MSGFSSATNGSNHALEWRKSKNFDEIRNRKIRFVHVIKHMSTFPVSYERDEKFLSDNERKKKMMNKISEQTNVI